VLGLGSEYRLSNALGRGVGMNTSIKPGIIGGAGTSPTKSFLERDIRVGPAHKRCAKCDNMANGTWHKLLLYKGHDKQNKPRRKTWVIVFLYRSDKNLNGM